MHGTGGSGDICLLYSFHFVFFKSTLVFSACSPTIRKTYIFREPSIPCIMHLSYTSILGLCCLFFQFCNSKTSAVGQILRDRTDMEAWQVVAHNEMMASEQKDLVAVPLYFNHHHLIPFSSRYCLSSICPKAFSHQ